MMYPAMTNVRLDEVGRRLPLAAPAGRGAVLQLPRRAVRDARLANVFVRRPGAAHRPRPVRPGARASRWSSSSRTWPRATRPMALVFVALNSVAQMILIPVYARLLIGNVSFDVWVVAESVVLYLGLPLVARRADPDGRCVRRGGEAAMERPQAGPERALDPGPAVHAHRDVRAQGRPDPAAPGDRRSRWRSR